MPRKFTARVATDLARQEKSSPGLPFSGTQHTHRAPHIANAANAGKLTREAMAVEIYALSDPETGAVRYIGKANNADARFKGHMREKRRKTPLYRWIAGLRAKGMAPCLRVLETCAPDEWQDRERALISAHADLLNVAEGGDEPFCPKEVRSANGRATAAKIHSNPMRKQIWELKRRIGSALRDGYVSDRAKAKLREAAAKCPQLFGEWAAI